MELTNKSQSLLKATALSFVMAIVTLGLFVLPAEYNIDPTGVGEKLGLTVFNQPSNSSATVQSDGEQDTVVIKIPAGGGVEYKLLMDKFQKAAYEWVSDGQEIYVDVHGEPTADSTGYFESYTIATVSEMKGSFVAPFAGTHGWYWKNNSDQDINIQLIMSGDYVIQGIK